MLKLEVAEVYVATSQHHGLVRVHVSEYLNHAVQVHIDNLVASSKDVADAMIFCEDQTIQIEAQNPTNNAEKLKAIARGFCSALEQMLTELDEEDQKHIRLHPNVQREAFEAYSNSSAFHGADRSDY